MLKNKSEKLTVATAILAASSFVGCDANEEKLDVSFKDSGSRVEKLDAESETLDMISQVSPKQEQLTGRNFDTVEGATDLRQASFARRSDEIRLIVVNEKNFEFGGHLVEVVPSEELFLSKIPYENDFSNFEKLNKRGSALLGLMSYNGFIDSVSYAEGQSGNLSVVLDKNLQTEARFEIDLRGVSPVDVQAVLLHHITEQILKNPVALEKCSINPEKIHLGMVNLQNKFLDVIQDIYEKHADVTSRNKEMVERLGHLVGKFGVENGSLAAFLRENMEVNADVARYGSDSLKMTKKEILAMKIEKNVIKIERNPVIARLVENFNNLQGDRIAPFANDKTVPLNQ